MKAWGVLDNMAAYLLIGGAAAVIFLVNLIGRMLRARRSFTLKKEVN